MTEKEKALTVAFRKVYSDADRELPEEKITLLIERWKEMVATGEPEDESFRILTIPLRQ